MEPNTATVSQENVTPAPEMNQTKDAPKGETKPKVPSKSYTGLTLGFIGSLIETIGVQALWFIVSLLLVSMFGWYTLIAVPVGVLIVELGDYLVDRAACKEHKVFGRFRDMFSTPAVAVAAAA